MLCDRCKKKEATFHKSIYINGNGFETHLCQDCAGEVDFSDELNVGFNFENEFKQLEKEFMSDFFEDSFFTPALRLERNTKKCDNCGSSFNDFLRRGKLGCSKCYDVFQDEIRDMLENMDNPMDFSLELGSELQKDIKVEKSELEKLTDEFNQAIAEERYEDAGELKKKINKIREKSDNKEEK